MSEQKVEGPIGTYATEVTYTFSTATIWSRLRIVFAQTDSQILANRGKGDRPSELTTTTCGPFAKSALDDDESYMPFLRSTGRSPEIFTPHHSRR